MGNFGLRKFRFRVAAIAISTLYAITLYGQGATATILGTITDSSGAAVPGASIDVTNVNTGFTQSNMSDGEGRFRVPELPVGSYEVKASKSGFSTTIQKNVALTVGSQVVVDLSLMVGQQQQTISVETEITQVETTTSTVASFTDQQQMRELPLNGRNFEQLILLAPGVQQNTAFNPSSLFGRGPEISFGGSRVTGFGILLDDESIVNFWNRGMGSITGTSLGVEAIGEFQTVTNTYGAQFGGAGAVVNAVSKSGTNAFHGSAYEFLRNDAFDAYDTFAKRGTNPVKPPLRKNQFGGSLGGPVKKDKAFFFVNYEGIQQSSGITRTATVPNCPAACTVTATGAAGTAVQNILNIYPKPDALLPGGLTGTSTQVATRPSHENYFLGRFDYNFSSKDSVFVRYISDEAYAADPFGGAFGQAQLPFWTETDNAHSHFATIEYRRIISPTLVNIARVSFSRPEQDAFTTGSTPALQFPGYQGREDGGLTITGLSALGASISTPFIYLQNRFTEADDLLWTHGSHNIRFGVNVLRRDSNIYVPVRQSPQWTFPSLSSFLAGTPSLLIGITLDPKNYPNRDFRGIELYPYVQDDWKITPKLTLNLGLRYEFETNPIEPHNQLYAITDFTTATFFTNIPHVFKSNPSTHNFAPRIGLAWDPFADHKTSIRAGFGIFYDMIGPDKYSAGFNNEYPWYVLNQANPTAFPNAFAGFVPVCVNSRGACPSDNPGWGWSTSTTPSVMQYNLTVQREIAAGTVLSVGFVGSHGIHLMTQKEENPPIPTTDANGVQHFATPGVSIPGCALGVTPGCVATINTNNRLNPNLSNFLDNLPISTSRYGSLQVSLNRRFRNNIQAQVSYAYSHCTDNGAEPFFSSNTAGSVFNPYNQSIDKGLCAIDIKHTLRVNGLYALPFHRNRIVDGWQLSGIVTASGGVPFTVTDGGFGQTAGSGVTVGGRPNYIGSCDVTSGTFNGRQVGTPDLWFNPGCFALEPIGTLGNMGRTNVRGPGVTNVDIAATKDTKLTERFRLQFRAELFNLFNHPNYSLPTLAVFSPGGAVNGNAGKILSTNFGVPARQVQFGLRLNF